jgi:hypothetical protein
MQAVLDKKAREQSNGDNDGRGGDDDD